MANSVDGVAHDAHRSQDVAQAVATGGTYELIRQRLVTQAGNLEQLTQALNERRAAEFGQTSQELLARISVRTEHNCVPRDIARVGVHLLFGYNVFIGLKRTTEVGDVFSAYEMAEQGDSLSIVPCEPPAWFLDTRFVSDFKELYAYYKHASLLRMQVVNQQLLVTFSTNASGTDIKVFRWSVTSDGASYIDERGERDLPRPATQDFEWTACGRDDQVSGQFPHYSILDAVFVDTLGGTLTVKLENNTEEGQGIFREPVEEAHQSLDDADVRYAETGGLILLRVLPYREEKPRYFVFNPLLQEVRRIDAIGTACQTLPEDHGIVFPGGCYLASGEFSGSQSDVSALAFSRKIRSPNGEDILYVFYERATGTYGLYSYNLIRKELANPIEAHGYSLFDDGRLVVFRSESIEPSRHHPMQIWNTAFFDEEHAARTSVSDTTLGKIGNSQLVRGVSELFSIVRAARSDDVARGTFHNLIVSCEQIQAEHFWLEGAAFQGIASGLAELATTAGLVLDEFEKVLAIRRHAEEAISQAEMDQERLLRQARKEDLDTVHDYVGALTSLRQQRGHLLTLRELRYIDVSKVETFEEQVFAAFETLAAATIDFLLTGDALAPLARQNESVLAALPAVGALVDLDPLAEELDSVGTGLDVLTEVLGSLTVDDATKRTQILQRILEIYAGLNATRAKVRIRRQEIGIAEDRAEFAAQFTLLTQSITSALSTASTPADCDEALARLSVQLEELENRFGAHDEFLGEIVTKREELFDTFEARKQALLDDRQRRAQALVAAGDRILDGLERRTARLDDPDELNTFFSSDTMVMKLRELVEELSTLDDRVKADDLEARLKAAQDAAVRSLRDKRDIFEEDGAVIRLGRHKFSVNTQDLELTVIEREGRLFSHLTGTNFLEPVVDEVLEGLGDFSKQALLSETEDVYRAEYLAAVILRRAMTSDAVHDSPELSDISLPGLQQALLSEEGLLPIVRKVSAARYQEGYARGVHDHDAAMILTALLPALDTAGLLRFAPDIRSLALLFWRSCETTDQATGWQARAQSSAVVESLFSFRGAARGLIDEIAVVLSDFAARSIARDTTLARTFARLLPVPEAPGVSHAAASESLRSAAEYLVRELGEADFAPVISAAAAQLSRDLTQALGQRNHERTLRAGLRPFADDSIAQVAVLVSWLEGYASEGSGNGLKAHRYLVEAALSLLQPQPWTRREMSVANELSVDGLLGEHPRIVGQSLTLALDEFIERTDHHMNVVVPGYRSFQQRRHAVAEELRSELALDSLKARPLASFVRNRLIDELYLSIIGDNLAKQMGTAGDEKRTDLMGLLLLISPPGYGKTTLMEYVASRLGLVFVKINGPALGHDVTSIDPAQAPSATAAQELIKLNLGLEMGNNVMLYLDDIQHTSPELLQKFISLCDGSRRIEGVWRGESKTFDLRGRKFCVVMAGNPYTESGEVFRIPDMLANRADVYNLGDVLTGREAIFASSYIENALTSNATLAPLAGRDMSDVYRFMQMARGDNVESSAFTHTYSGAEISEIVAVLQKLFSLQEILLRVNLEYIASAAKADAYRTEPPFLLQGSYRNMNKLAEKVVAMMNDQELDDLIVDHYAGEAQLLTSAAEQNLLKLGELRDTLSDEQKARWADIKRDFARRNSLGGEDDDVGATIAAQLSMIAERLSGIGSTLDHGAASGANSGVQRMADIGDRIGELADVVRSAEVQIVNQPSEVIEGAMSTMASTIETTFMPVVASMDRKIDLDLAVLRRVNGLKNDLEGLEQLITELKAERAESSSDK